ncbi:MAG: VanZ family protein [Rhodoferax sp.]
MARSQGQQGTDADARSGIASALKWSPMRAFWHVSFWTLVLTTLWLSLVPVAQVPPMLSFWDKAQHAFGFAALGFSGLMAYAGSARCLLLSLALLGVGIEVAQGLSGWRYGDWQDWMADCLGLLIARLLWQLACRRYPDICRVQFRA